MGLLDTILGGGVGKMVKDVVGSFKLDPETKAKIDAAVEEHSHELAVLDKQYEAKLLEARQKEVEVAGANIRAEAASDSFISKNARPLFIFIGSIVIWANYLVAMIAGIAGRQYIPVEVPDIVFQIYILGFGGYVAGRSYEKVAKLRTR